MDEKKRSKERGNKSALSYFIYSRGSGSAAAYYRAFRLTGTGVSGAHFISSQVEKT